MWWSVERQSRVRQHRAVILVVIQPSVVLQVDPVVLDQFPHHLRPMSLVSRLLPGRSRVQASQTMLG